MYRKTRGRYPAAAPTRTTSLLPTLILAALLLAGCDWRSALGLAPKPAPPPPLPPGQKAGPERDPLFQVGHDFGAPLMRVNGPILPNEKQAILFRGAKGNDCISGVVVYNLNGTGQSTGSRAGPCGTREPLDQPSKFPTGDQAIIWGLVTDPRITRVTVSLNGQPQEATVQDGFYWILVRGPAAAAATGYDKDGKVVYQTEVSPP